MLTRLSGLSLFLLLAAAAPAPVLSASAPSDDSAVIHWEEGGATLNAAIPRVDYDEHVEAGRIVGPGAVPGTS